MQDEQAVSRLKQGDLQSLEPLVARYYLPSVRAAYLILQDKELAEDVVQTSFLNLASTIHQYDVQRPFGPWFMRCVVNAAINTNYRENRLISMDALKKAPFLPKNGCANRQMVPQNKRRRSKSARQYKQRWQGYPRSSARLWSCATIWS